MTLAHDDDNGAEMQTDLEECSRSASVFGWCMLAAVLMGLVAGAVAVLG